VRDHDNLPKYFIAVVEDITGRVQAEQALRDREQQLVMAQSAARLGLWDHDLRTGVTVTSGQYARLHGLEPDHPRLTHEEWLGLIHPDDRERIKAALQQSIERTHVWDTEFRVVWPNGSVHWLLGKGQVFLGDAGRPIRLAGVTLDIAERKRTEQALQQSEERFRLAVKATNDAIWDIDLGTGTVRWNERYATLYGRPSETINSWQWWIDHIHSEDRERTVDGLRSAISGVESTWTCEYRFQQRDGAWAHIYDRAYIARDASGKAWRVIGAMQDLTERKRAESVLRESEERFRNLADAAPVMIWVSGPDRLCNFFNKGWLEFRGRTMEQEMGNGWAEGVHPDDLDRCIATYASFFDARHRFQMEYRLRRADGQYRWVLDDGAPRFAPDETFAGYIGSCIDITELRRTQQEALARQKLEDLGVLAGGIAHDFNNLLGSILTKAELVEADLAAGLSPGDEIARIKTVAIRGAQIVRELMIYAGHDQASLVEPVDLSRLAAEMLELLKVSISKQARLKINLDKNLPAVWGNAPQIRQVLMNLVINASEAIGDKEGVIQVTTSCIPASDQVRLEVSDNGCGLTEEAKAKIFDPFFTTKFAGRGLGLAVVQGIVRAHGGAIDVASAPGMGASVPVSLPCASKRALEVQNAVTSSGAERSRVQPRASGTVLVVEDEEVLRLAVSKALQKRGFSVMEAKDGSVAMDLMRTCGNDIDVILLDVTLPGTSSREVFEEAQRMRANLKVVLTSAYDRKTADASFPGLRITQFIRKPFQLDDLACALRDALAS
jgi:two-component system cell cycle sensor histidine kinase/response regulator CckA